MQNRFIPFVCNSALLTVALIVICPCSQLAAQKYDPTKVTGDLQKIKAPLSKLIKFNTKGGRLDAIVEKNRTTAYQHINSINSIGGNRGGGSSSSGNTWEIRINNNSFEGTCNYGYSRVYPKPNPNTWKIKLKELKKPGRDLFIEAGPNGEISITLYGGDDPYLLRIRQQKSGSIFVQEVSDTEIFSESSASFDAFCRQHSKFTQDRLLPIIRHLGIDAPMTQFDKVVQDAVVTSLTPIEEEQLTSFQTSFKNLDSSDYNKRKADAKKLSEGFDDWRDFVLKAVNDSDFSFEVRFRLMEALEKNGKPEVIKASRYAISADLANNPEYLVWLYEINEDQVVQGNILNQLRKATGKDLGGDIAAWKVAFADSNSNVPKVERQPSINLLEEKGAIDNVNQYVGELVRLKNGDNKLQLDRKHWESQFGGKSIQQLVKETNENLAKLNMPASYDPDPLFELGSVGHPQAIFAKMRSKLQSTTKSSTVYYYSYQRTSSSSLNRQFNNNDISISMDFQPNETTVRRSVTSKNLDVPPPKLDGKPFKIDFRELGGARRSLMVNEQVDGRLRVALVTEASNAFVQMLQQPDGGFVVQDVRGPDVFTAKAGSFTEFVKQHKVYCDERLFPLFSHFGIRFTDDLFKAPPKPKKVEEEKKGDDEKQVTPKSGTTTIKKTSVLGPKIRVPLPRKAIRIAPKKE